VSIGFLIYLLVGKFLIFFGMKFAEDNEIKFLFLKRLLSCGLCFGVWVYSVLSIVFDLSLFPEYMPHSLFSQVVTGMASSLFVHLVSVGWREQFSIIRIE